MSEEYICRNTFDVLTGGQNHKVSEIHIPHPTGRMQSMFARLEGQLGAFNRGLQEFAINLKSSGMIPDEAPKKEVEEEKSNDELVQEMLEQFQLTDFDFSQSYTILKDILCAKKGGATCVGDDGEFELKAGHWDDIPMSEIKRLLAFYFVNFINTSD
jgi:hypothetical protein